MDNPKIPIVFTTDHNYIMQTGVCLLSLIESSGTAVYDIYILIGADVTSDDMDKIKEQVAVDSRHTVYFIRHNDEFINSWERKDISSSTYYRLLIPWILPDLDKVIFSDVDVIINTSLSEIYTTDLGDNYFGAVPAVNIRTTKAAANHCRHNKIDVKTYYNAGFLLINSRKLREENVNQRFLSLASKRFTYQDQDIINLAAKDRIKEISTKYCILPIIYNLFLKDSPDLEVYYGSKEQVEKYLNGDDCIIHYAGPKPWNSFTFEYSLWWSYYQRSIFYDPYYRVSQSTKLIRNEMTYYQILRKFYKKIIGKY